MDPVFPCPVKTWHNDTYPSISPTRPELGASGKTIVITGGGGVIGHEVALAFAQAGAKSIALIGRSRESLEKSRDSLPRTTQVTIHCADVAKTTDMKAVARSVGTWDVLVLGAANMPKPGYIAVADEENFWSAFEINTKSIVVTIQSLTPLARPARAVVLGLFPGAMCLPARATAGLSGYLVSKMAQVKLLEYVAAENSNIFAASVHPGMIDSPLFRASGTTPEQFPMDTTRLAAHFILWMASEEAKDLCGKSVWANWDADELKLVGPGLQSDTRFTAGILGWPFSPN